METLKLKRQDRIAKGLLKIGEIANEAGLLPSCVRFYTQMGFLKIAAMTKGGYWLYDKKSTLEALAEIAALVKKGHTLDEIKNKRLKGKNMNITNDTATMAETRYRTNKRGIRMSRLLFSFMMFMTLTCALGAHAYAGDIEAKLNSNDGSTTFDVKDSGGIAKAQIDSDGNAVITGGMRLDSAGVKSTVAEELVVDGKIGIGSITPDAFLDIEGLEDTERVRLTDTTNVASVGIYVGTGSPSGALAAQKGSLFLDESGALYQNTDGANTWTQFTTGGGGNYWTRTGTAIATATAGDTLRLDANSYLNFGAVAGAGGYGIRDNAGVVEFKNSGGGWSGAGTGDFKADGSVAMTGNLNVGDNNITNVGDIALDSISADDGASFSMGSNWTNAGRTIADLGTITTADINGGTIDSTIIGGTTPAAATVTTVTAKTSAILEDPDAGTNTITLQAPATLAVDYALTFPVDDGGANQVLTTDGSGVLTWSTPSGTGANTALSNLAVTAINASLVLATDSAFDLGSSSKNWANVYADSLKTAALDTDMTIEHDGLDKNIIFKVNDGGVDTTVMTMDGATGNIGISNVSPQAKLHIGTAGTSSGVIKMDGVTSGTVTLQPANAAGTWTMTLPTAAGTSGWFLKTDGAGVTSWAAASGVPGGLDTQVQYNSGGAFAGNANLTFDGTTLTTPNINGSTADNGDITIQGTSSATKTTSYVNLQPTGGNVGIGTTAPAYTLDLNGALNVSGSTFLGGGVAHSGYFSSGTYAINVFQFSSGITLGWTSGTIGGASDIGLSRGAAGKIYIGNGTLGDYAGTLIAGNVGIGTTAPSAVLHLKAGTATASTAPLKFTSGTVLGTTEAGTVEYDGSHLYFTATDAGTRYQLDQQTGAGGLDAVLAVGDTSATHNLTLTAGTATAEQLTSTDDATVNDLLTVPNIDGSTVDNGDITIQGTSSATKTTSYVNLQPTGGNVGIGTTAPGAKLDVSSATNGWIWASSSDATNGSNLKLGAVSTNARKEAQIHYATNFLLYDTTATANRLVIDSSGNLNFNSGDVYFQNSAGNVGIGTTAPSAVLHLKAGTATASTAPLKFTSGTVLGTTEAGTVEYDGTHLYFTAADAGTRYQLDQQTGAGGLDAVLAVGDTSATHNLTLTAGTATAEQLTSTDDASVADLLTVPNIDGSTADNGDITIQGTSSATRTTSYVNLQPTGGNVGIGTTSPTLHLSFGATSSYIGTDTADASDNKRLLISGSGGAAYTRGAYITLYGNEYATTPGNIVLIPGESGNISFYGSGGTEKMRMSSGGNVGIGTTAPSAVLHLKAGTATASTAPLKFTSGTVLGTTEAGAVEYDGTHLYFTATNAGTRYQLDQQTGAGGLDAVLAVGDTSATHNLTLTAGTATAEQLTSTDDATVTDLLTVPNIDGSTADNGDITIQGTSSATKTTSYVNLQPTGGDVGVGTANPLARLDVRNILRVGASTDVTYDNLVPSHGGILLKGSAGQSRTAAIYQDNSAGGPGAGGLFIKSSVYDTVIETGGSGYDILLNPTSGGNVGIGTTTPASKLDIEGGLAVGAAYSGTSTAPSNGAIIEGRVGIGTTSPGAPLHVYNDQSRTALTGSAKGLMHLWAGNDYTAQDVAAITFGGGFSGDVPQAIMGYQVKSTGGNLFFGTSNAWGSVTNTAMYINHLGNVGIGTTSPENTLTVQTASGNSFIPAMTVRNPHNLTETQATGILFSPRVASVGSKGAIAYRSTASFGRGAFAFLQLSDAINGDAGLSDEVMTILNDGNVGIGTTAPANKLHVEGTGAGSAGIYLNNAVPGTTTTTLYNSGGDLYWAGSKLATGTGSQWTTSGSDIYYSTGNVGIGTTAPAGITGELTVDSPYSNTPGSRKGIVITSVGSVEWWSAGLTSSGHLAIDELSGADSNVMTLQLDGKVGIGTTAPSTLLHLSKDQATTTEMTISNTDASAAVVRSGIILTTDGGNSHIYRTNTAYSIAALQDDTVIQDAGGGDIILWGTAEIARFKAAGNVGIGVTNPANKLDIEGALAVGATYSGTSAAPSNGAIIEGNVGIGTTAPGTKLDVVGIIKASSHGEFGGLIYAGGNPLATDGIFMMPASTYGIAGLQGQTSAGSADDIGLNPVGGNVGIGTTAPAAKLHIVSSAGALPAIHGNTRFIIQDNSTTGAFPSLSLIAGNAALFSNVNFGDTDDEDVGSIMYSHSANTMTFRVAAGTKMLIDSGGNVGIGTTSPANKLDIEGALAVGATYSGTSAAPSNGAIIEGRVGIGTTAPASALHVVGLPTYANNAAAVAGGLTAGAFYRTGGDPDQVCVVH